MQRSALVSCPVLLRYPSRVALCLELHPEGGHKGTGFAHKGAPHLPLVQDKGLWPVIFRRLR